MAESFVKYVGDTERPFLPTFADQNLNPIDITNAMFALKMKELLSGTILTGTGTWSILSGSGGTAEYDWSSTDVATPGTYLLYVMLTINGKALHADPILIALQAVP